MDKARCANVTQREFRRQRQELEEENRDLSSNYNELCELYDRQRLDVVASHRNKLGSGKRSVSELKSAIAERIRDIKSVDSSAKQLKAKMSSQRRRWNEETRGFESDLLRLDDERKTWTKRQRRRQTDRGCGGKTQFFEAINCRLRCELESKKRRTAELKFRSKKDVNVMEEPPLPPKKPRQQLKSLKCQLEGRLLCDEVTLQKLKEDLSVAKKDLNGQLCLLAAVENAVIVKDVSDNLSDIVAGGGDDDIGEITLRLRDNFDRLSARADKTTDSCALLSTHKSRETEKKVVDVEEARNRHLKRLRAEKERSVRLDVRRSVLETKVDRGLVDGLEDAAERLSRLEERTKQCLGDDDGDEPDEEEERSLKAAAEELSSILRGKRSRQQQRQDPETARTTMLLERKLEKKEKIVKILRWEVEAMRLADFGEKGSVSPEEEPLDRSSRCESVGATTTTERRFIKLAEDYEETRTVVAKGLE